MHGRIPHSPAKARANALTGNREIVLPAETSITVKLLDSVEINQNANRIRAEDGFALPALRETSFHFLGDRLAAHSILRSRILHGPNPFLAALSHQNFALV